MRADPFSLGPQAVLVLCLKLGNINLPLSDKKQAGVEIVGLSCQCSVLVLTHKDRD
jgi:hypothetical protein